MKMLLVGLMALVVQGIAGPLVGTIVNGDADTDPNLIPNSVESPPISTLDQAHTNRVAQDDPWKTYIATWIGTKKQYVGQYSATSPRTMFNVIYETLWELCPTSANYCIWRDKKVQGVAYKATRNGGKYSTNAWFTVSAGDSIWHERARGLREPLIHQAAGAYEIMTKDEKNCFYQNFQDKDHLRERFCNVASWVTVGVYEANSKNRRQLAILTVKLEFNSKSIDGVFDCRAVTDAVNDYCMRNTFSSFRSALSGARKGFELSTQSFCREGTSLTPKDIDSEPMSHAVGFPAFKLSRQESGGSPTESPFGRSILRTTIGHMKQYVGQLNVSSEPISIFTAINESLWSLCPDGRNPGSRCDVAPEQVSGVEYRASDAGGVLASNAYFEVGVSSEWVPSTEGLLKAMIYHVARVYELMTKDEKNCFYTTWEGNGFKAAPARRRFCNVANWVAVSIEVPEVKESSWANLNVTIKFNSKSKTGHFDCVAVMEAIDNFSKRESVPEFENIFDVKGLVSGSYCPDTTVT